jgi:hypothetical protein
VVDAEVVAGLPHKGYDERAPQDGYHMAAGLNEMFTAPLVAKQRGSVDFEESITAITRHVIEEFSNLQVWCVCVCGCGCVCVCGWVGAGGWAQGCLGGCG